MNQTNFIYMSFNEKILELTTVVQYLQSGTHHLVNRLKSVMFDVFLVTFANLIPGKKYENRASAL